MTTIRISHVSTRHFMAILLLLTALLPVQQAFACDMMGGQAKATCCCVDQMAEDDCGSGGCSHTDQAPLGENGCCEVTLAEPATYTSQNASNLQIGVTELVEPPQPPLGCTLISAQNNRLYPSLSVNDYSHHLTGHQTYLQTQRLRI